MIITFPHMGYLDWVLESVFRGLDVEVAIPDRPGKRSLELGVRHSPELACLPFKMNLGDLLNGVEKGADTFLCVVDEGPCRLGYYGTVHQAILRKLGYDLELIPFEYLHPLQFISRFTRLGEGHSWEQVISSLRLGWQKLCVMDEIEEILHELRPYPEVRPEAERIAAALISRLRDAYSFHAVRSIRKAGREALLDLKREDHDRLVVAVLGEIYVVLEPAVNFEVERLLGELGVIVKRTLFLSHSVKSSLFMDPFSRYSKRRALRVARPYLKTNVGAECNQSVGLSLIRAAEGCDGVMHLLPFTCAPELVARTLLCHVSRDKDIPILSLILDEHTGEAGIKTRVEAFVDLLERRRRLR